MGVLLDAAQPRIATTAALKLVALPYRRIRRDGFVAPGDAGGDADVLRARQGGSRGICFEMGSAPGVRTAGSAIVVGGGGANSGHQVIEHNGIVFPYDGITVGDGVGVVSMPYVNDNHVLIPARSGISVGRNTAYGATNELRASNNTVVCQQGSPPSFTGSISGTPLTASNVTGGDVLRVGMQVVDAAGGVAPNTIITAGSGSTWTVSVSQTVGSRVMAGSAPVAVGATGLAVFDAALVIGSDNEFYGCGRGTALTPGANQLVLYWARASRATRPCSMGCSSTRPRLPGR